MAAITNGKRKEIAMQHAEALTDIWDVFKAWMGRAAEIVLTLCMFGQLIGMLPGVSYPGPTNSIILGVELIMLDFGAFALAPLAEHARNIGQDEAAIKAESMAAWLIRLVMTTIIIVIVGQFSPIFGPGAKYITGFVKYAEPVLILVRVGFIVKYIHVIHSLRGSTTLAVKPTPTPAINYQEVARQVAALLPTPAPEHPDYKAIAAQVAPLMEATIVREIKAIATIAGPPTGPQLEARASSKGQQSGPIVETAGPVVRARKRTTGPLPTVTVVESQGQNEATDTRATEEKLEAAYQQLAAEGGRISGRSLAPLAKVNKGRAAQWLRATHPEATGGQGQDDEATTEGQE